MNLSRLTYAQLDMALRDEPDDRLIDLLDDRSIKVGDTASCVLSRRGKYELILRHAHEGKFRTRNGKIRAMNTLGHQQRKLAGALDIYLRYLNDKNRDVAGNALFFIVLWNDKRLIPVLRSCKNAKIADEIEKAIAAIEAGDYRVYSPYFDDQGTWTSIAS